MKSKLIKVLIVVICLAVLASFAACSGSEELFSSLVGNDDGESELAVSVGTLRELGLSKDGNKLEKFLTLDEIYFPDGMLETNYGLFIWHDGQWLRTNLNHDLLDADKDILIYIHGMGGNGSLDLPDMYQAMGYNVLSFMWGTYACEPMYTDIVNKIVYREDGRWSRNVSSDWEEEDICSATIAEVFGAYYYDLMAACPNYNGSQIQIVSFSYGGMVLGSVNSYMTTAYTSGLIPTYMVPDMITMLDPFFSRTLSDMNDTYKIVPWLGENTPANGNMVEAIYQSFVVGRELGISYRMFRASDPIVMPAYFPTFGADINTSYWNLVDSLVYTHLDQESSDYLKSLDPPNYLSHLHGLGYDWVLLYYIDKDFYDTNAKLTKEHAFSFNMPYEVSFARCGAKYTLNLNDTLSDISDDKLTSGNLRTLADIDEGNSIEKAKICGFAYMDKNGNGILDERVTEHFSGATVTVTDKSGKVISKQTTKVNGYYEVEVDATGEYNVAITLPSGYTAATTTATCNIIDPQFQCVVNNFAITK